VKELLSNFILDHLIIGFNEFSAKFSSMKSKGEIQKILNDLANDHSKYF